MKPQTLLLPIAALSLAFSPAQTSSTLDPIADLALNSSRSQATTRLSLPAATDLLIQNNLSVIAACYNVDILHAQRIAAGLRPNATMTFSATQSAIPRPFHLPLDAIKTNNENGAANTTYTVSRDRLRLSIGGGLATLMTYAELRRLLTAIALEARSTILTRNKPTTGRWSITTGKLRFSDELAGIQWH